MQGSIRRVAVIERFSVKPGKTGNTVRKVLRSNQTAFAYKRKQLPLPLSVTAPVYATSTW